MEWGRLAACAGLAGPLFGERSSPLEFLHSRLGGAGLNKKVLDGVDGPAARPTIGMKMGEIGLPPVYCFAHWGTLENPGSKLDSDLGN